MSPQAFVSLCTNGKQSYPGAGGLYRDAMAQYNVSLRRYTLRRARALPAGLRNRLRDIADTVDAWDTAYYRCGWTLLNGTFWCDAEGGDTLRKERMLEAFENAFLHHGPILHASRRKWEREVDRIVSGLNKRRATEAEPECVPLFNGQRKTFLELTRLFRYALRRMPRRADGSVLFYLRNIHENMNDLSYHFPG